MPEIHGLDPLLNPISQEQPTGANLRQTTDLAKFYYQIKDARLQARTIERNNSANGEFNNDANKYWQIVADFSSHVLTEKTKDIEIAAWLTEAWTRLQGFWGLSSGFKLLKELIDKYWDKLYPEPDEEGVATKVAAITGLNGDDGNGSLLMPIQMIVLTQGQSPGPFAVWHYQQALELNQLHDPDALKAKLATGGVSMDMLKLAAAQTRIDFFTDIMQALNQTIANFNELTALLQQKCGDDAPPSSAISQTLALCLQCLNFLAKDRIATSNAKAATAVADNSEIINQAAAPAKKGINDREAAFALIQQAADYFRQHEPLSPFAYSLDQIIRWSGMQLPDLLKELIPDENARTNFFLLTGISQPPADKS